MQNYTARNTPYSKDCVNIFSRVCIILCARTQIIARVYSFSRVCIIFCARTQIIAHVHSFSRVCVIFLRTYTNYCVRAQFFAGKHSFLRACIILRANTIFAYMPNFNFYTHFYSRLLFTYDMRRFILVSYYKKCYINTIFRIIMVISKKVC